MSEKSVTTVLGEHYTALTIQHVPEDVIVKAKLVVLDCLANAVMGSQLPTSLLARRLASQWTNQLARSTAWIDGLPTTPSDAAFVNSALIHCFLKDDSLPGTSTHGGSMILPATLALAEDRGCDGSQVLLATIVGYDVQGRLGARHLVSRRIKSGGRRGSPVIGPICTAAAGAICLSLDADGFGRALNMAANTSSGLLETTYRGTPEFRYQNAFAARNGVTSALLAEQGLPVAETTLDGPYGFLKAFAGLDNVPDTVTADLGVSYEISRVIRKPVPTCGNNIRVVQVIERVLGDRKIMPENIEKVRVLMHPEGMEYPGVDNSGPFHKFEDALFSMQFAVAATLMYGCLEASAYVDVGAAEIAKLASQIDLVVDASVRHGLLEGNVEIFMKDGEVISATSQPADDSRFYPTADEAIDEFHRMTNAIMRHGQREAVVEAVLGLDRMSNISDLTQLLVVAGSPE